MDSEETCSGSEYSLSDYSDVTYDSSFIDDSELDDDTFYFDDYGNITHFNDDNIAEAEAELHYTLADLGKLRIYS